MTHDYDNELDYENIGIEEEAIDEWPEPQGTLTKNLKLYTGWEFYYVDNCGSKKSKFIEGRDESTAFDKFERCTSYMCYEKSHRAYFYD